MDSDSCKLSSHLEIITMEKYLTAATAWPSSCNIALINIEGSKYATSWSGRLTPGTTTDNTCENMQSAWVGKHRVVRYTNRLVRYYWWCLEKYGVDCGVQSKDQHDCSSYHCSTRKQDSYNIKCKVHWPWNTDHKLYRNWTTISIEVTISLTIW